MDDLTRRDFLRAAGLAVAGIAGTSSVFAQEDKKDNEKKEEEEKPEDKTDIEDLFGDSSSDEETRACPQCGALMYLQGNTWTCDNCGYSYVE